VCYYFLTPCGSCGDFSYCKILMRENWSLTLRKDCRLENGLLTRIFGAKWDEVKRIWIRLHNEELHKDISRLRPRCHCDWPILYRVK
jgi:hypothetical protein